MGDRKDFLKRISIKDKVWGKLPFLDDIFGFGGKRRSSFGCQLGPRKDKNLLLEYTHTPM